ncbi:hypothetical protein Tsubulata_036124, partial [Turnera subulata]
MNTFSHVPPGFRFHPTDEELVNSRRIDLDVIRDVDLYKIEPWDLQELCRIGTDEQNEWYFFSHKDKKYPTGTRTNRATAAGFWKATGRDKAIYAKHDLIGMRKTLVFYKGRAPNGQKSDWIMHEYRLETEENGTPQASSSCTFPFEEGWVVCRVFKKRIATMRKVSEHESVCWFDDQVHIMHHLDSPKQNSHADLAYHLTYSACKKEQENLQYQAPPHDHFLQLPLLQSPKLLQTAAAGCNSIGAYGSLDINLSTLQSSSLTQDDHTQQSFQSAVYGNINNNELVAVDQVTDWRVLDKFVASQLSQEDVPKERITNAATNIFSTPSSAGQNLLVRQLDKQETMQDNASTSTSGSTQVDLWK